MSEEGRLVSCAFLCGACRILCYMCCRRMCCCVQRAPSYGGPRKQLESLCLGLEGAGKSSILAVLAGEEVEDVEPTLGFSIKVVNISPSLVMHTQELGGSQQIRQFWERYYARQHLIIFVIDSSSSDKELTESCTALLSVLLSSSLSLSPLLLLCSKQDLPTARPINEISAKLDLDESLSGRPHSILGCSVQDPDQLRQTVSDTVLQLFEH